VAHESRVGRGALRYDRLADYRISGKQHRFLSENARQRAKIGRGVRGPASESGDLAHAFDVGTCTDRDRTYCRVKLGEVRHGAPYVARLRESVGHHHDMA